MIRGLLRSLFVVGLISGTALAEESPVQVVDRPAAPETAQATPTAKKTQKKHKTKHKARKHRKPHHSKAKAKAAKPA